MDRDKPHDPEFIWPGKEPDNPDWDDSAERTAQIGRGVWYGYLAVVAAGMVFLLVGGIIYKEPAFSIFAVAYVAVTYGLYRLLLRRRQNAYPGTSTLPEHWNRR